jgi:aerobic carbon-monoxide dehydrogenase medium subunit
VPLAVHTPDSVSGVLEALGEGAVVIAGGTHVMPRLNTHASEITSLVSLRRAGLAGVEMTGDHAVRVGAATTLTQLGDAPALAFLRPALDAIASPTIRNLATVGGNLFVPQPYGDLAVCLLALDAQAELADGRTVPVAEAEGLVTAITFAIPAEWRFLKAMRRRLNSASIVTVAAVLDVPRIALGGVAPTPVRARHAEAALADGAEAAAQAALQDIDPFDDAYASAWYRRRVVPVHVRRALLGEEA